MELEIPDVDPFLLFLGTTTILAHVVMRNWYKLRSPASRRVGRLEDIRLYPMKGAQALRVKQALATPLGLKAGNIMDRRWMLVNRENEPINAKQEPRLQLVELTPGDRDLTLTAPGMSQPLVLSTDFEVKSSTRIVSVYVKNDYMRGADCGNEASNWFCRFLHKPENHYRLIYWLDDGGRKVGQCPTRLRGPVKDDDKVIFQSNGAYHMMGRASVDDVNSKLDSSVPSVPVDNFRPNIIVEDCEPYAEDFWPDVFIGQAKFSNYMPTKRCIITTTNTERNGFRKDNEPLATMRKYRLLVPEFEQSPALGRNVVLDRPGVVKVGDDIYAVVSDSFIG